MKRFFIVGCGRSGTTMLQQALNRHPQVVIPPETAFFSFLGLSRRTQADHLQRINGDLQIEISLPRHRIGTPPEGRALYEEMVRLYLERLGRHDVTHFGEKSPEHQRRLGRIRQLFPDAKVVLIYRDGRDVACSLTKLAWMSRNLYVNFALWLHYYRLQQQAVQSRQLDLYCVKYEELVTEPERELRRILDFLGLPYAPQVAEGFGNADGVPAWEMPWKGQALEKITTSRVGRWRSQLSGEQVRILERWGGPALRALGYELITDGRGQLPWLFFPRLYANGVLWLARRPGYGGHAKGR